MFGDLSKTKITKILVFFKSGGKPHTKAQREKMGYARQQKF